MRRSALRPARASRRHARPALAATALAVCTAAAACGGDRRPAAGGADSELARDLTLANGVATRPPAPSAYALGGDTAAARSTPAAPALEAPPAPVASEPPASPRPVAAPARVAAAPTERTTAAPRRGAPAEPRPAAPVRRAPAPDAPVAADDATARDEAPGTGAAGVGAGAGRSLAAGTVLTGTLGQRVCSESNRPGDRFVATLGSAVSGPSGVVLPAGTPLVLEVSRVEGDPPAAEFVVRGVSVDGEFVPLAGDASPVTGATERREVVDKASSAGGKAVTGAIAGAILGRVLGGRGAKGTIIGAAGGAAAGAAMGRGKSHEETCVAGGADVRVRLTERLTVR